MTDALPSLIIAVSDLKVVSLLRDAINSGLPKTGPLGTIPPGANPHTPRPHPKFNDDPKLNPSPVYGPTITPTPRIEPRTVIHPTPRVAEPPPSYLQPTDVVVEKPSTNPIQPPWRVLPWPKEEVVVIEPKVYRQTVDLIHKGTLLDMFM